MVLFLRGPQKRSGLIRYGSGKDISFVFSYHVVHNPGHSQGIGIYAHRYLRNGRISVSAHVSLCAVVFK